MVSTASYREEYVWVQACPYYYKDELNLLCQGVTICLGLAKPKMGIVSVII